MQATEYDLPSYDLFNRESSAFAGSVTASDRGPTVLCINDVDIPCRSELYTTDRVTASLFIVGLVDPGWSKVPYVNQNGKTIMGDKPKALSEWVTREDANGKLVIDKNKMVCYAYLNKKGKLKDKGVRVDGSDPSINNGEPISYVLEPGMVMRCMMKKSGAIGGTDKEKRESFFPSDLDVIPAFSRLVVKLACKGWDKYVEGDVDSNGDEITKSDLSACYRGYGCGIQELRVAPGALATDRELFPVILPSTPEEMRMKQTMFSDSNWAIRQIFQCSTVPFLVSAPSSSAYVRFDDETDQFKVFQWDNMNGDCIDLGKDMALRACNATDVDSANQLLDIALAMGAIQFVCFANDFRSRDGSKSKYIGYPVISSSKIMNSVVVQELVASITSRGGEVVRFDTGKVLGDPGSATPVTLCVNPLQGVVTGEVTQPNPELPIVCNNVSLERAYAISFQGENNAVLWTGFFNVSKPSVSTRGGGNNALANAANALKFGRKRWGAPENDAPRETGGKCKIGSKKRDLAVSVNT